MKVKNYVSPEMEIMMVYAEGVLCGSGESGDDSMKFPGADWKEETEWSPVNLNDYEDNKDFCSNDGVSTRCQLCTEGRNRSTGGLCKG